MEIHWLKHPLKQSSVLLSGTMKHRIAEVFLAIQVIIGGRRVVSLTDRIKSALGEVEMGGPSTGRASTVIAVASQKGGVGKTTTAVNLASSFATDFSKRVLLIDLDGQGHSSVSLANQIPGGVEYEPLSSIFAQKRGDLRGAIVPTDDDHFWITPGDKDLHEIENLLSTKIGKEYILQRAMAAVRGEFDLIIIDCPPTQANLTLNALVAADFVMIPCEPSRLAIAGVSDMIDTIELIRERLRHETRILGILLTKIDIRNRTLNAEVLGDLSSAFPSFLFETRIPLTLAIPKSQAKGVAVRRFDPHSKGALFYRQLANECTMRMSDPSRVVQSPAPQSSPMTSITA